MQGTLYTSTSPFTHKKKHIVTIVSLVLQDPKIFGPPHFEFEHIHDGLTVFNRDPHNGLIQSLYTWVV